MLEHLLFLARKLPGARQKRLLQLLLVDHHAFLLAHGAKHQAKPHPALSDAAIFLFRRLFGGAFVNKALAGALHLAGQRLPDAVEFGLHQLLRQIKAVKLVERIQHIALELHHSHLAKFLGYPGLDHVLELDQILKANLLGKYIINRGFHRLLNRCHLDRKFRRLARQFLDAVSFREGHLHGLLIAGLGARQLVLKARNELAGADFKGHIVSRAAVEYLAIDSADKTDHQAVALFSSALPGLKTFGLGGEPLQRLANVVLSHVNNMAHQFEAGMILQLERRDDLESQREGEIALAIHDGLNFGLVLRQFHFRLIGGLQIALARNRLAVIINGLLHHLGHGRLAVNPLQMTHRHLAGTKALDVGAL